VRGDLPIDDLLERASALAACPLFESLAPAVVIRLAERARSIALDRGARRTTEDTVWIVATGAVEIAGEVAGPGGAIGMIRVVRPETPVVTAVATEPATLVALAVDDVRDVLEEDPGAVAALVERVAALLLT
jgi:CRP-like cAMP-binding protein